jgi:hypothetical protein
MFVFRGDNAASVFADDAEAGVCGGGVMVVVEVIQIHISV